LLERCRIAYLPGKPALIGRTAYLVRFEVAKNSMMKVA